MSSQVILSLLLSKIPNQEPTNEGDEFVLERILKHRKKGRVYLFVTHMKHASTHGAEWHPTRDFKDKVGTMNPKF